MLSICLGITLLVKLELAKIGIVRSSWVKKHWKQVKFVIKYFYKYITLCIVL